MQRAVITTKSNGDIALPVAVEAGVGEGDLEAADSLYRVVERGRGKKTPADIAGVEIAFPGLVGFEVYSCVEGGLVGIGVVRVERQVFGAAAKERDQSEKCAYEEIFFAHVSWIFYGLAVMSLQGGDSPSARMCFEGRWADLKTASDFV